MNAIHLYEKTLLPYTIGAKEENKLGSNEMMVFCRVAIFMPFKVEIHTYRANEKIILYILNL